MKRRVVALFASFIAVALPVSGAEAGRVQGKALHLFRAGHDGLTPATNVIDVRGTLYGTTVYGGGGTGGGQCEYGCGTVFAVTARTGAETVLHAFGNESDGVYASGPVTDVKGMLYGVTQLGGASCSVPSGCGIVYAVNHTTGTETVVYSFCRKKNCTDGLQPSGNLIDVDSVLYGTTEQGGAKNHGTVFALDPKTGKEKVIYSFQGGADGAYPSGGVTNVNGTFYGATAEGGPDDAGTLFELDPVTGTETVLHSFDSTDGANPNGGLLDVNGTLYGTTIFGGNVFGLDLNTGQERTLYTFLGDGGNLEGGLIYSNGSLYGTSGNGGAHSNGFVFAIDPETGVETTIYEFCSAKRCTLGYIPGPLIDVRGMLYGTTAGGPSDPPCDRTSCGTVFSLKP